MDIGGGVSVYVCGYFYGDHQSCRRGNCILKSSTLTQKKMASRGKLRVTASRLVSVPWSEQHAESRRYPAKRKRHILCVLSNLPVPPLICTQATSAKTPSRLPAKMRYVLLNLYSWPAKTHTSLMCPVGLGNVTKRRRALRHQAGLFPSDCAGRWGGESCYCRSLITPL